MTGDHGAWGILAGAPGGRLYSIIRSRQEVVVSTDGV